ncbi:MAG: hypothetical protein IH622_22815 [Ochrobactrum anthropi]|uniref:Uncharacterized protein n=1 Tax=Brucella anthropi TaxID=529 RepID=A0A8I0N7K9_BRUAN|nr:hypothetical protein [Brucella anthropi]MBE0563629.1 hypothetical protein [Brucella anthropi]
MTPEEKKAKKAAYMREYNKSEKARAATRRYRQSEKGIAKIKQLEKSEKRQNYLREYRKRDRTRELKRAFNHSEKGKACYARFKQTEKYKQYQREYNRLKRNSASNLPPLGEYMKRALLAEPIYAQVHKIVPYKYPRDVRDDIIMEIVLAILEGTHTVESAAKNLSKFVPGHHRDSFKQVSMDAPVAGTDNLRIGDRIAADAFHF